MIPMSAATIGAGRQDAEVIGLVGLAHERHGSLTELPWDRIVAELVQWQPARRSRPRT